MSFARQNPAYASASSSKSDKINVNAGGGRVKDIPEFLRVETGKEAEALKSKLVEALKPDEGTVNKVMQNPALLSGFDDPEVMRAVDEIAKDPTAFAKYRNNKKVLAFYQQMAGFVGERLTEKGSAT